jgi:hypothetical protein
LVLGLGYFQVVWGLRTVDPRNLSWILAVERDLVRHLTSISYYRTAPWSFPITSFDSMLYPVGTNVAVADGLPLFAVAYKLLDPLLPAQIYQYFGAWLLACVWLQAWLAKKITGALGLPTALQWLGVVLVTANVVQALAIWHAALWGHWTYLCGFYLITLPKLPHKRACGLAALCPWIHPYLLAMTLATLGALFVKHRRSPGVIWRGAALLGCLLVSCWLVGYFEFPTGFAKVGGFSADALSLVNSAGTSSLVPALLPMQPFDESYAYLGLGGMLLACVLLVERLLPGASRRSVHALPLLGVCASMALYSLGSSPKVLGHSLGDFPALVALMAPLEQRLRGTGRFTWPIWHYVMLFGLKACWELCRDHSRLRLAVPGLIVALQLVDVGPWLTHVTRPIPDAPVTLEVPPELLARREPQHRLLLVRPPVLREPCKRRQVWRGAGDKFWGLALWGARERLKTNSDFFALARVSKEDSKVVCETTQELWEDHEHHPDALFVQRRELEPTRQR